MVSAARTSELSQHDEIGELAQPQRATAERSSASSASSAARPRAFSLGDAHHAHVCRLVGAGVLACRLAQRRRRRFGVEQIVDDLECKPDTFRKVVEAVELGGC
jgi:hypothetical protein